MDPDFDSAAENVLDDEEPELPGGKPIGQYPGQRGPGKTTITLQNGRVLCIVGLAQIDSNLYVTYYFLSLINLDTHMIWPISYGPYLRK